MNKIEQMAYNWINHYNAKYYWNIRPRLTDKDDSTSKVVKRYWLLRLKLMESYNNASLGTYINRGAIFEGTPILPHGLRGIHITDKAHIGKNCTIFQQTVIGVKYLNGGGPIIGDNCLIGAGAMVLGEVRIGNNVVIGANCVVDFDVPDNTTVVGQKPRIIRK